MLLGALSAAGALQLPELARALQVDVGVDVSVTELGRTGNRDLQGYKVAVAGHEVFYDSERDLLYCDIEIDVFLMPPDIRHRN